MQCEEYECEASTSKATQASVPELTELDSALHELGMLSSLTESRKDYLRELTAKRPVLNLVEMNTRFVSSVSIGLRMKPVTSHLRMKPYAIPVRPRGEERHRTRSENADVPEAPGTNLVASVMDAVVSVPTDEVQSSIKKSKSLENVHLEDPNEQATLPEVELVSTCIQKLKMAE